MNDMELLLDCTIDTLNTHNIIDDLTVLTPPSLEDSDTLNLSISLAKGLKSLITVDTKSWQLPKGSFHTGSCHGSFHGNPGT